MIRWTERRDPEVVHQVRTLIEDLPELHSDFDKMLSPPIRSGPDKWERESAKRKRKRERKEAVRIEQWERWREEIQSNPVDALSEKKRGNTLGNFFKWLGTAIQNHTSWGNWSLDLVAGAFSTEFLEHLQPVLSTYWRKATPQTWSEKAEDAKNTTSRAAIQALSAIKSEADTPGWAEKLAPEEAELATKLSMVELNGFAAFLPSLEKAHPEAVHGVIIRELEAQLGNLATSGQCPVLNYIHYHGSDGLKAALANRLLGLFESWPSEMAPGTQDALRYAADLIAGNVALDIREAIASVIEKKIDGSAKYSDDHQQWVRTLAVVVPEAGCQKLLTETQDLAAPDAVSFGVRVFGSTFGDRHHAGIRPDFADLTVGERARLLADLVSRAYEVAHPSTDVLHRGVNSPDSRDFAEEARRFLFDSLLRTECFETYRALGDFAGLVVFDHMKDRLLQMRAEMAANFSEPAAMHAAHFRSFDTDHAIVPTDNRSMHQTMLNRLEDFEHFVLESEFSNRVTLQRETEETELRRNIANWLNDHNRGVYRVNQEAVKVNEKRTDIRLNSVAADIESAIELKLDDTRSRWSGADLEYALREQLVGRYLSHERCLSGCLLIVMREERRWAHPQTGARMSLPETVAWLQSIADTIVAENPQL